MKNRCSIRKSPFFQVVVVVAAVVVAVVVVVIRIIIIAFVAICVWFLFIRNTVSVEPMPFARCHRTYGRLALIAYS